MQTHHVKIGDEIIANDYPHGFIVTEIKAQVDKPGIVSVTIKADLDLEKL